MALLSWCTPAVTDLRDGPLGGPADPCGLILVLISYPGASSDADARGRTPRVVVTSFIGSANLLIVNHGVPHPTTSPTPIDQGAA